MADDQEPQFEFIDPTLDADDDDIHMRNTVDDITNDASEQQEFGFLAAHGKNGKLEDEEDDGALCIWAWQMTSPIFIAFIL